MPKCEGLLGLSVEDLKSLRFVTELLKKNPEVLRKMFINLDAKNETDRQ